MNLDYFRYCKELLIKLNKAIESNDNYKIYQLIPSLIPVVAITYYCLVENIIITKDENNPDINTRFKLNIPNSIIDKLFEHEDWINTTKKMTNSRLWLLSSIRNSIMHGSSVINIDNNKLTINNPSFKNQLDCEIDLKWFINFLLITEDVGQNYISDKFSVFFTGTIEQMDKSKNINNFSSDYIYSYLIHFFNIEVKSKNNNRNPVPNHKIIDHIINYTYKYIEMLNSSIKSDYELSFINCLKKHFVKKESETEDEFNASLFKYFFKKHIKLELEEKFPNYEFDVNNIRPSCEFKDFLDEDEMSYIFKLDNIKDQTEYASSWITSKLMINLFEPFKEERFFRDFIDIFLRIDSFRQPEYISDSDMSLLLNSNNKDAENVIDNILTKIKSNNTFVNKTYDKVILKKVLQQDFRGTDFLIANNLLNDLILEFDYFGYDNEEALIAAKKKCPYLFDKYSIILKEKNSMSDQDIVILDSQPFGEIRDLKELINQNKNELIQMIIYLAGINCYVLNKESVFDTNNNIYESMIDDSFVAYSKTVYDHDYLLLKQRLDKINARIENIHFSDKTPQHVIDKFNIEKQNLIKLKRETEEKINKFEIIIIDKTNMVKVDKRTAVTLIRNSISHPERIDIMDNYTIKLMDFDNKGNISGVVFVPLNKLLDFFLNDTFESKLEDAKQDETSISNKMQ